MIEWWKCKKSIFLLMAKSAIVEWQWLNQLGNKNCKIFVSKYK